MKKLLKSVDIELAKRKTDRPEWPVGTVARTSLGFSIPIGPIIIIGTDPDEGIDLPSFFGPLMT